MSAKSNVSWLLRAGCAHEFEQGHDDMVPWIALMTLCSEQSVRSRASKALVTMSSWTEHMEDSRPEVLDDFTIPVDVPWPRYSQKKVKGEILKVPLDEACRSCKLANLAWPEHAWTSFVARAKATPEFKAEVLKAKEYIADTQKVKDFHAQDFSERNQQFVMIEKELDWYSMKEFTAQFGNDVASSTQMTPHVCEVMNERGEVEKGVAVECQPPKPRKLKLVHCAGTDLSTTLLQSAGCIRAGQGAGVQAAYQQHKPAAVSKPLTMESIEKIKKELEEALALPPPPLPASTATATTAENTVNQTDEEEEVLPEIVDMAVPPIHAHFAPEVAAQAKGKGKSGKGRGKGRRGAGARGSFKRPPSDASTAGPNTRAKHSDHGGSDNTAQASQADGSARSRSPARTAGGRSSTVPKLESQTQKYLDILTAKRIIDDEKVNEIPVLQHVHQASRTLKTLEREAPNSADHVKLKARLSLCSFCKDLMADKISALTARRRQQCLEEVTPHLEQGAGYSSAFRQSLLRCVPSDRGLPQNESEVVEAVERAWPLAAGSEKAPKPSWRQLRLIPFIHIVA
eukprot:3246127-Amphidinium_carterae.1